MKKRQYYDLAIIGGGITGLAIAYKSSLLGLKVVLIEKEEIGHGASGHFHEFLHSGVRYAVVDPDGAKECYEENQRLQRPQSLARDAINQTGGFFIALTESDVEYFEILVTACQRIGIPVVEVAVTQVIREIPQINKKIKRALYVPDGHINGKRVLEIYKKEAEENGVHIITYQQVIGINTVNGRVDSV